MDKSVYSIKTIYSIIAFAITVYINSFEYKSFCVVALVCLITAGAILFPNFNPVRISIRCRSPPVDSKRKILN